MHLDVSIPCSCALSNISIDVIVFINRCIVSAAVNSSELLDYPEN